MQSRVRTVFHKAGLVPSGRNVTIDLYDTEILRRFEKMGPLKNPCTVNDVLVLAGTSNPERLDRPNGAEGQRVMTSPQFPGSFSCPGSSRFVCEIPYCLLEQLVNAVKSLVFFLCFRVHFEVR